MEFVSAIIGPIVESVMIPVKKQLSYLFSSRKHVRNMSTRMEHLDGTSLDVRKHMEENIINNLEIPTCVPGWLEKVEKVKNDAHRISSTTGNNGCFNMKMRYRSGRNAFKITEDIESLTQENRDIIWRDTQKPLGKVKSKKASASASLGNDSQNYFKSREKTFNNALEFLQQDHTSQVIALCGMGGVGKTTMMEQLKRTAEDKNMFDWIVKVVIGQKINMLSIQQTVADYLGQPVTETSKAARADRLRIRFGNMSEQKKKVLVILDDLWEMIALQDMGLSPLPNGFKVLLTSRYENICKQIAVEANSNISLVSVDVMDELEAHNFFFQITGVSEEYNQELNQIGSDIVRRCGFLPLAIKLIATTLKFQEKFVWRDTLHRLKKKNLDRNVQEIIEISYTYIKEEEEKAIFLLCGLFPDDFNIPIEELTRYAWGLQLLNDVSTLGDARDRTKTCVQNIKNASLLIDSDYNGCVKMHDLVLAYVLGRVSKGDHPWIINHGDISEWSRVGMHESCKRISITCSGMSEFPGDSKYPNLSLLRLMNGDKLLKFPEDCYDRMENLEVIGFEYPLLPRSLQFSTKLRTLILHQCLLMFDCSAIGELVNLEVLSFANCGITKLPSTIGKLKELKLLDLTGCVNLRIDDGVLRNLVKLEELYMRAVDGKFIRFTDENRDELAECSKHLSALEFEFFENNGKRESMLFADLQRFKISMGRGLGYNIDSEKHSFKNTLKLATNKDELLDSRMNELFGKTEVLYLEVGGMNDIEEVLVDSVHLPMHLFNNLKDLDVSKCENLKYLFTAPMTSGLMKLERLRVSKCPVLEVLVYGEDGGAGVIKFQELKFLSLAMLPKLVGFCNTVNVLELPQLVDLRLKGLPNFTSIYPENSSATSSMSTNDSDIQPFLKKEVLIPKLKTLWVHSMNKLKEIWPEQFNSSDEGDACILRNIQVEECDNIVNLFPTNPMLLLRHLEILRVKTCRSIEVLFNIDMRSVSEIEEYSSNLRHIYVSNLGKLRELWRMKGESSYDILIRSCQTVEYIEILCCESFANISTPTLTNSDVGIDGRRPWEERRRNTELIQKSQEISVISKEKSTKVYSNIPDVAFQKISHKSLKICGSEGVNVVFEVESSCSRDLITTQHNQQPLLLPCINELWLCQMETMSHVWKCKLNKHVIPPNQSFHNLTTITLQECKSIKYLFSPLIGKLLTNLKKVSIYNCEGIEEIVSNRYDDNDEVITSISAQTNTMFCHHLESLDLHNLPRLKSIDGGNSRDRSIDISATTTITTTIIHDQFKCSQVGVASWFLCQFSKRIVIHNCRALSRAIPSYVAGQLRKLQELSISECESMIEVFETEGVNNGGVHSTNVGDDTCTTMAIPRSENMTFLELPNLSILKITYCKLLEHIFTSSMLESLKQLKILTVEGCKAMEVIVKEDRERTKTSKTIVFPRLKSITLADLPNVKGFFFGMNEFRWPLLEEVMIYGCPHMMNFTSGHSMAPKLNYIHTGLGKHSLECGLNFHMTIDTHEPQLRMCSTPDWIKLLQFPWSFSNLVEVNIDWYGKLLNCHRVFPCNELLNLKNLEKLCITDASNASTIEVFEVDVNEIQSVVVFQKLKEVTLDGLRNLTHMWKYNPWIVLNFPNLTKVSIGNCPLLGHVFTCCMVGSLLQLQELQISDCENMDVIVKQVEDSETRVTDVVFPCLKSLTLYELPNLKGFCLGRAAFLWPSLDTLEIKDCPQITVFTHGQSTTPELKLIDTTFGLCHATEDPTSFIKTKQQEGWQF